VRKEALARMGTVGAVCTRLTGKTQSRQNSVRQERYRIETGKAQNKSTTHGSPSVRHHMALCISIIHLSHLLDDVRQRRLMLVILANWEDEIRRIMVQETPISKIIRAKWMEGMAYVVGQLFCKCKALSSNPGPTK
jgi:hypothetical protein